MKESSYDDGILKLDSSLVSGMVQSGREWTYINIWIVEAEQYSYLGTDSRCGAGAVEKGWVSRLKCTVSW